MKLHIFEDARSFETELTGPLELGRQQEHEPGPYAVRTGGSVPRLVIAWNPEVEGFSREHLRLEPLPGGRVRVRNRSQRFPVPVSPGDGPIPPGGSADLVPPFRLTLPGRTIAVSDAEADGPGLLRLAEQTLVPDVTGTHAPGRRAFPSLSEPQLDQVVAWLQTTIGVLNDAVGSAAFLPRAAEALVEIVGLHAGRVLLHENGRWAVKVARGAAGGDPPAWQPSDTVLGALLREKRTVWERRRPHAVPSVSLEGLQTVVAAPLLDAAGGVVGVLYGERFGTRAAADGPVGPLEAVLVELLAGGVAAGLARQRQEQEAARNQTLFEQFFTAPLAAQLRERPDLLRGRAETVTVLFCDVRRSSAIGSRLEPDVTERWIHDVLGELSRCVLEEGGVLVDYAGDELMAMWGAPTPQPDQTERAARAALAMLRARDVLNDRWRQTLDEEMDLGVGVNRGRAQVGNMGSAYKFKYGPLGDVVNVASRTQGMTKHLKCRLLVTADARAHLGAALDARRVCQVRLVNIPRPVQLYEVAAAAEGRSDFFRASEQALDALEARQFAAAGRQAAALLEREPGDGPALLLMARAADALMRNAEGFDLVWTAPGK
jgi:adenylate cyclase